MAAVPQIDAMWPRPRPAVEPLGMITLGLFPSKEARVETSVSAVFMDTGSGYVYGLAEASAKRERVANAWTSSEAVDQTRAEVDREAFDRLLDEVESTWEVIVARYGSR